MRKVEAEIRRAYIGALLLDMGSEHGTQSLMQKMGSRMVIGRLLTFLSVHHGMESTFGLSRDTVGNVDAQIVLLDGIDDIYLLT